MQLVMVLDDGETWAGLSGCKIVRMTDEQMEEIEEGDAHEEDFDAGETVVNFTEDDEARLHGRGTLAIISTSNEED